jgi:hypothetical protein
MSGLSSQHLKERGKGGKDRKLLIPSLAKRGKGRFFNQKKQSQNPPFSPFYKGGVALSVKNRKHESAKAT